MILDQLYRTGILQQHFEIHHYVGEAGSSPVEHGVTTYGMPDHDISGTLDKVRPDRILLVGEIGHFNSTIETIARSDAAVTGWFPVNFERHRNPYPWAQVLQRCDSVVAQAEFGRRQLQRDWCGRIPVIGPGVNLDLFKPVSPARKWDLRRELGWGVDDYVYLYVGRNNRRKGVELAVEAFRMLRELAPQTRRRVRLYLHTDTDRSLLELLHASDLVDSVWLTPEWDPVERPLSGDRLAALYQAADVFFLPSNAEGFGMPLLEAQAVGLPIVASDSSAIPEVVGQAGLLIDAPGRITAYDSGCIAWARSPDLAHAAALMLELFDDDTLSARLSMAGRRQARRRSWSVIARRFVDEVARSSKSTVAEKKEDERSDDDC